MILAQPVPGAPSEPHTVVQHEPQRFIIARLDPEAAAHVLETCQRGSTVLWCGRIITYIGTDGVCIASVCRGEDETADREGLSTRWQARINARAAGDDRWPTMP